MATVVKPRAFKEPKVKPRLMSIEDQRAQQEEATLADVKRRLAANGARSGQADGTRSVPATGERFTLLHAAQLVAHPQNPRKHFDEEKLASLAATIREHGILQPLVVRDPEGDGNLYQIVCGERRWRAAQLAGVLQIPAVVKQLSNEQTLELMIVENEERADLNPIELAEGIDTLCRPVCGGGAGLSPEQAGAKFGKSESWAKNLRRLLQLPEKWKARVVSGEMPQTFARELVPLIEAPAVLAAIEKELTNELRYNEGEWPTREEWERICENAVDVDTRPVEADDKPFNDYRMPKSVMTHGRLFALTDELRAKLQIVRLPVWSHREGKTVERERATNVELFDELNEAAKKALLAKKEAAAAKRNGKAESSHKGDSSHKPSAEELAEKRKQQDEQLARKIGEFRLRWLRCLMVDELSRDKLAEGLAVYVWLANQSSSNYSFKHGWSNAYERAAGDAGFRGRLAYDSASKPALAAVKRGPEAIESLLLAQVCETLWPKGADIKGDLPPLEGEEIEAMADLLGCDLAAAWEEDLSEVWRAAFFELHTSEQLEAVAKEIKSEAWLETKKADKVRALAAAKSKLPKSLKAKAKRG